MARSYISSAVVISNKYTWPDLQLNIWNIIVLAGAGLILGVFAAFMQDQNRMGLGTPWLFPYGITVGALTIVFIIIEIILIIQRRLLPGFMLLFSFMFLVLYLAGLIETSIQLFGAGNVSDNCNTFVQHRQQHGVSLSTLAWLEQDSICSSWYAAFSFWLILCVFFVWMMIMAAQVSRNSFE
ncbi:hypothetical protein NA57DRAFT_78073 [Rhizodiscina lignyota]|uniref:MARVEL domain-containing protein n=1 Tax=Rhizodiscina lignyota TaxID=1504668 RepID=A0A9P4ICH7_9PEZI|nr:hypothetical protein NA57DRAFT_78073 [Rhizodiscina lignyota]